MNKLIKENLLIIIGVIVGLVAGYLYWLHVGCSSGGCIITSSPIISTIYGGVLGGFLMSIFKKKKQDEPE